MNTHTQKLPLCRSGYIVKLRQSSSFISSEVHQHQKSLAESKRNHRQFVWHSITSVEIGSTAHSDSQESGSVEVRIGIERLLPGSGSSQSPTTWSSHSPRLASDKGAYNSFLFVFRGRSFALTIEKRVLCAGILSMFTFFPFPFQLFDTMRNGIVAQTRAIIKNIKSPLRPM